MKRSEWTLADKFDEFLSDMESYINEAVFKLKDSLTGVSNGSECPADTKLVLDQALNALQSATNNLEGEGQRFRDKIDTLENQEEAIREEAMEYYMNQD